MQFCIWENILNMFCLAYSLSYVWLSCKHNNKSWDLVSVQDFTNSSYILTEAFLRSASKILGVVKLKVVIGSDYQMKDIRSKTHHIKITGDKVVYSNSREHSSHEQTVMYAKFFHRFGHWKHKCTYWRQAWHSLCNWHQWHWCMPRIPTDLQDFATTWRVIAIQYAYDDLTVPVKTSLSQHVLLLEIFSGVDWMPQKGLTFLFR